ncbi:proline-rich receptor-like protein kinase PERK3 isoform X2 [Impatiens glandulifera]|uniref:proline-rich receptor-like protein kinase PERK3 isoform X2 n=1 Tax=Impatiens glandulifera TaxID=253017 RepID=UPI001FB0F752|nr:proline-rich receptor-like protein kinase PERK3 isoform X2 [Impatiens glandulifera]
MSITLPSALGGAAGGLAFAGFVAFLIWFFFCRKQTKTSETGSSDPSIQGRNVGVELSSSTLREARNFELQELLSATKNFSDRSLIGEGKFGAVYKGLLNDGMLVAIKKRAGAPSQEFIQEVQYLSSIRHRNLVTLIGYCQENDEQILVYEYIPNGSVSVHLYGLNEEITQERIEFKKRLSIALGAAKGLAHLHSLSPRLLHKDFKTANVLVDENFVAKVADFGIRNFLGRVVDVAGPSTEVVAAQQIFLAPEVREFGLFTEKSDVYSFGIFLLELVSGREASGLLSSDFISHNLVENLEVSGKIGGGGPAEGMEELFEVMVRCVEITSDRRPSMGRVVTELERIHEKEMSFTTLMGGGGGEGSTPVVTLGSQLFKSSSSTAK